MCHSRQGVVVALALPAGDASLVSDSREFSRSLVSPAEHVGEQIEGVAGCRASGRSGGTARSLDEFGNLRAQAVSNGSSSGSISARLVAFFRSIFSVLLLLASDPVALVTLSDEIPNSLRLRFNCVRLVGVAMPLRIPGRSTNEHCGDNNQP